MQEAAGVRRGKVADLQGQGKAGGLGGGRKKKKRVEPVGQRGGIRGSHAGQISRHSSQAQSGSAFLGCLGLAGAGLKPP